MPPYRQCEGEQPHPGELAHGLRIGRDLVRCGLVPEVEPHLQTLLWEHSLPPSAALEQLAAAVTPLIATWDDREALRIFAASADREKTRQQLARAGAMHGPCKVERALWSDGAAKARFLLTCADGALELSQTIDAGRQITRLSLVAPRTMANCAP